MQKHNRDNNVKKSIEEENRIENSGKKIKETGMENSGKKIKETGIENSGKSIKETGMENSGKRMKETGMENSGKNIKENTSENKNIWLRLCDICIYVLLYFVGYLFTLAVIGSLAQLLPPLTDFAGMLSMGAGGLLLAVFLPVKKLPAGNKKALPGYCCGVFLLALGSCVVLNVAMSYLPWELFGGSKVMQDNEAFYSIPFLYRILAYGIIAPLAEELLFRGVILHKLKTFMPAAAAIVLSGLAFGIYHGNLQQGIYGFLCGMLIGWIYVYTDSFLMCILFHGVANITVNIAYAYSGIGNLLYSWPVVCLLLILAAAGAVILIVQNKCSKKY